MTLFNPAVVAGAELARRGESSYRCSRVQLFLLPLEHHVVYLVLLKLLLAAVQQELPEVDGAHRQVFGGLVADGHFELDGRGGREETDKHKTTTTSATVAESYLLQSPLCFILFRQLLGYKENIYFSKVWRVHTKSGRRFKFVSMQDTHSGAFV